MATAAVTPEDVLTDYFPRRIAKCTVPTDAFFKCLFENSKKVSDADVEAGLRGVRACLTEKKGYEACMAINDVKFKDPTRFRVQEEYRIDKTPDVPIVPKDALVAPVAPK